MKFVPRRLSKTADLSRGDTSWQSFVKNSLSVVIVFVLGYLALGLLASLLARTIPDRWEARLFALVEIETVGSDELARAEAIFERLTARPGLRPLPYRIFVIPRDEINAFAYPGGGVGVTAGLLEHVSSEIGLAMVLGHELGHHHERHPLSRLGRALVFAVARGLLFGGESNSAVNASLTIAGSGHSRRQERAADAFGLRLVHEVYGDTEGSLEFFERLQDESGADEVRWAAFLRSHPMTSNRIENLRQLRAELQAGD